MNLSQSNLAFRQRTPSEAADLGRRLIGKHLLYYSSLYAALNLPILLLGSVLFWGDSFWLAAWLWWLKPLAEYGILAVLSVHAFDDLPPWKTALKQGLALMLRSQIIGDLTWRRIRLTRSFDLPIQQLEQLSGPEYRQRKRELSRYGNGTATVVTLFGNTLENIWTYALMVLAYWFLYGNFIEQGLVQPNQINQIQQVFSQLFNSWTHQKSSDFLAHTALAYFVTLAFWGPFYVASGFTLYLNARVQTEAWDIRLMWQQLRERIRGKTYYLAWMVTIGLALLLPVDSAYAETLPDATLVEQNRQQVLEQAPYFHLENQTQWCWGSCHDSMVSNMARPNIPSTGGFGAHILGYLLLIGLVVLLAYGLWQWRLNHLHQYAKDENHSTPSSLFGLDVNQDSLPKNVSQQALHLLQTDPRAALSLLYRASLYQFLHQQKLPIQEHHTEGQVLQLVQRQSPAFHTFFHALTQTWLHTAYGHQNVDVAHIQQLCQQYAQHFETGKAP